MGWDDELVTVGRFNHVGEAELARMALEAAGIDSVLADEYGARMGGHKGTGGVRLQVRRRDVDAAGEVLQADVGRASARPEEPDESRAEARATCRRCGSEELYPKISRGVIFARATVAVLLIMLLANIVRLPNLLPTIVLFAAIAYIAWESLVPRMQCRNCRAEWRGRQM